jgi:hypothetical protein
MTRLARAWCIASFALLPGCGDEGDVRDAVAACQRLAQAACTRSIDCLIQTGAISADERADGYDACYQQGVNLLHCDRATSLGPGYDACMSEVQGIDCKMFENDVLPELPAECQDAIRTE